MTNSQLFKQAHKMTKLTIQPNETYRYKFGQWLIFLKTGVTNTIKPQDKKVNQSVCYVPILQHDSEYHNTIVKTSYSLKLPLTLVKTNQGTICNSYQHWHVGKMLSNPLSLLIISMLIWMFLVVIK